MASEKDVLPSDPRTLLAYSRDVRHESLDDASLKRLAQALQVSWSIWDDGWIEPRRLEPAHELVTPTGPVVSRRELVEVVNVTSQCLHFGGKPDGTVVLVSDVERHDADRVSSGEERIALCIRDHESEDTIEFVDELVAILKVQGYDGFAVACCQEGISRYLLLAQLFMVPNLAID